MDIELGPAEMLQLVANKVIGQLLWPVYINRFLEHVYTPPISLLRPLFPCWL
jgi:hypothetical protein